MEVILGKMGELVLKGLNRKKFEDRLLKTLRFALKRYGQFKVSASQSTVYIEPVNAESDLNAAMECVRKTFGMISVCKAYPSEKNLEKIIETVADKLRPNLLRARTFKVEAKRADKTFPLRSPEISRTVGGALDDLFPDLRVDVVNPEVTVFVEIRELAAYVHADPLPAVGGLPHGMGGLAAVLLSGGIDSPVAAWMLAKRGFELEAIHFHSYPYTSERARQKVLELASILAESCGRIVLHIVSFTEIQEKIRDHCPEELVTLVMRRCMMRVAERIAVENRCSALITGECLGQVASQTIEALTVTGDAVDLPVLRPVIGMDKNEIVEIARKIGTYETSIQPYEDCCTVFSPKHPETKPKLKFVLLAEETAELDVLETSAAATCERLVIDYD